MSVIIWHNPRCSKSRQTLALLEEAGVEIQIRRYLDDPPTRTELVAALTALQVGPEGLVRHKEALFGELGLSLGSPDGLLDAMATHPRLIERPLVISGDRAALGRPPESVLTLLDAG
jgi:arsenate reductase